MIEKIFNVKSPFWQSMGTVFDLFILNILWVVCSLPIITIGPATTAAYYTLIQRARDEQTELHRDFFRSFKANFKQGTIIGLIVKLVGAFLAVDIYLCRISGTGIFSFFLFFFGVILLFWAMTALYVFPLLSKFERTTKDLFLWAFTLSIKNIAMTGTMLFVIAVGMYFCYRLPGLLFIMFGLLFQYSAMIFASIFKPYLPEIWHSDYDSDMYDYNPKPQADAFTAEDELTDAMLEEAALYGYDPAELAKLMNEENPDE